jgi:hypothetical protein
MRTIVMKGVKTAMASRGKSDPGFAEAGATNDLRKPVTPEQRVEKIPGFLG